MARRKTYGVSFSWKRALGISAARGKIARATGIPTTRSGMERKIGRAATSGCSLYAVLPVLLALILVIMWLTGCRQAPQTPPGSGAVANPPSTPASRQLPSQAPTTEAGTPPASTQTASSAEPAVADTVYITDAGERYHRGGCSSLRRSKHSISLETAKARGYTPCQRCAPPE